MNQDILFNSLEEVINQIIKDFGFIEVDKFINLCLYHDKFGYYKNKNPFGLKGDFITSPQMTSIFGEMIGLYIASYFNNINQDILKDLKNNPNYQSKLIKKLTIIELGAGNGFFMRDCLSLLKNFQYIYNNINIIMVETSDKLISEQKTLLKQFTNQQEFIKQQNSNDTLLNKEENNLINDIYSKNNLNKSNQNINNKIEILWLKDLYEIEDNIEQDRNLFIFSNEFFDAFAIKQFIKIKNTWREIIIKSNTSQVSFEDEVPLDSNVNLGLYNVSTNYEFAHNPHIDFTNQIEEYLFSIGIKEDIEDESIVEISPQAISAYKYLVNLLYKNNGQMMTIDYGFIKTSFNSTLKSVQNHKEIDILSNLGNADITYLVDFTMLNNLTLETGLRSFGIVTQRDFFLLLGIEQRMDKFIKLQYNKIDVLNQELTNQDIQIDDRKKIEDEIEKIKSKIHLTQMAIERIISENQMGNLFKVLICEKS